MEDIRDMIAIKKGVPVSKSRYQEMTDEERAYYFSRDKYQFHHKMELIGGQDVLVGVFENPELEDLGVYSTIEVYCNYAGNQSWNKSTYKWKGVECDTLDELFEHMRTYRYEE